jgi:acetyl/propionyl-CoA carboxylase alpha subunit
VEMIEVAVAGSVVDPAPDYRLEWIDRRHGVARLVGAERWATVVVEGEGRDWFVTLRGRRVPVTVTTWREKLLTAAAPRGAHGGRSEVRASLPGLVVAVRVRPGDEVAEGDPLLTIEAMKMQNEVRAQHAGRVAEVAVAAGQTVAAGALLLRLEEG